MFIVRIISYILAVISIASSLLLVALLTTLNIKMAKSKKTLK